MRTLWAASLRHLLRHPAQLALALLGLALGVATVIAVDIAVASSRRAFELSMQAVNGAATHQIVAGPEGVDEELYAKLKRQRWPLDLAPVVEGYVAVGGRTLQLVGYDLFADPAFRDEGTRRDLPDDGESEAIERLARWITEPGAAMLSASTAAELGLAPGSAFEVLVGGQSYPAELVATLDDAAGGATMLLTDIAQAQEWLASAGRLTRIDVRAPPGEAGEKALEDLRDLLPAGTDLREARQRAAQNLDLTAAFTTNLQAMSLLALLVSIFLIYSAVSFAVVQRRRSIGILRALGATRGGVLGIVLAEAAVLGCMGAVLGIALGTLIGRELIALVSRTINDLYFVVSVREVVLPTGSIVKALASGIGVALVAAALPAAEVANSAPQLGLRRSVLEGRTLRLSYVLLFASLLLAAAAVAIVWLSSRSLFAGFVALLLLLASVAALTPAALRAFALLLARLSGRASPLMRLAFGDVAASLSRTGVAVAALGMAVAAMIGVSVMVESFRESLREWLERTMRADVYVSAPGPGFGRPERRLEPEVVSAILAVPGIANHSATRSVIVESAEHGPVPLSALDPAPESFEGIQLVAGEPERVWREFREGAIVVSEPLAWRMQLEPGDRLVLLTPTGARAFDVAGVYREYGNDRGTTYMDRAVYRSLWGDDAITSLGLYLTPGVSAQSVIPRLRAAVQDRQILLIRSNEELREISMRIFDRTFVITRVLYWLTAGVAAIALVSALLAWELERARELAILRSLGLTPAGSAVMIEAQTAFMGFAALLAAIPAGLAAAVLLIDVINRRAFGWRIDLHVDPAQIGDALLLSLTAALVAGLYPAWRAGRVPLASEIREE